MGAHTVEKHSQIVPISVLICKRTLQIKILSACVVIKPLHLRATSINIRSQRACEMTSHRLPIPLTPFPAKHASLPAHPGTDYCMIYMLT